MTLRMILAAAGLSLAAGGVATAQDTGVPACNDFYDQYAACVATKIPEAQRAGFRQQIEMARNAVKDSAANAAARPQIEQMCVMQKQQIAQAMKPYGCEFK